MMIRVLKMMMVMTMMVMMMMMMMMEFISAFTNLPLNANANTLSHSK